MYTPTCICINRNSFLILFSFLFFRFVVATTSWVPNVRKCDVNNNNNISGNINGISNKNRNGRIWNCNEVSATVDYHHEQTVWIKITRTLSELVNLHFSPLYSCQVSKTDFNFFSKGEWNLWNRKNSEEN